MKLMTPTSVSTLRIIEADFAHGEVVFGHSLETFGVTGETRELTISLLAWKMLGEPRSITVTVEGADE